MMVGQDDWDPALKREVELAQNQFLAAYHCCFRRERLYRYCHYLETGEKPHFNLIGSWLDEDLRAEIALWKKVREACFSDEEAIDYLMALFEERFAHSWEETVALGSHPDLAASGWPVWDVGTETLLPQRISQCLIERSFDYRPESGRRDNGYSYRNHDTGERADIYLYEGRVPDIPDGVSDYILSYEISHAMEGAMKWAEQNGVEVHDMTGLVFDTVESLAGSKWNLLSVGWCARHPDGRHLWTSLGVSGFRGGVAKTRLSMPLDYARSEAGSTSIAQGNADLAAYLCLFR